jgi:crotonobetainyl-CoA:carnitine CoA-transferase CaiB-like acyl-CoA transferase
MSPDAGHPPLQGLLVVAVEQAVAGPLATRHLADLGARVIKVERPGTGDFARDYDHVVEGLSSHFVWLNRGKESVALDLADSSARTILDQLLDRADVFLHNVAPLTAQRFGLAGDQVRATRPALISCEISGYGPGGPYAGRKAYDLLVQAEAGLLQVTGTPGTPCKAGIPVADIAAGMYAFSVVLAALYQRQRTGTGCCLSVSLFDALAEWMGFPFYYAAYGDAAPARRGAEHASIAPYGPFTAADGKTTVIAVQNDREWQRFCAHVLDDPGLAGRPDLATNAARSAHRAELNQVIGDRLSLLSTAQLTTLLEQADVAYAHAGDVARLHEHPQLVDRGRIREVASPAGSLYALEPPTSQPGWSAPLGAVPGVGEHTGAILRWIGAGDDGPDDGDQPDGDRGTR